MRRHDLEGEGGGRRDFVCLKVETWCGGRRGLCAFEGEILCVGRRDFVGWNEEVVVEKERELTAEGGEGRRKGG